MDFWRGSCSGEVSTISGARGSATMLPRAIGPSGRNVKFGARRYDFFEAAMI
jgi:hypothetical protein